MSYRVLKLADGVSFVHIASHSGEGPNPLTLLPAFKEFVRDIRSRTIEPPATLEAEVIGSYDDANAA